MIEKDTFKKILGLTQEEIAILLGISRGQWSMYDCGKRELPLAAALEFTKMMEYIRDNSSKNSEKKEFIKEQKVLVQDMLKKEIKKNEYKIDRLNQKIRQAERFYNDGLAALRVVEYLDTQPENERTIGIRHVLKSKAKTTLRRNYQLLLKHSFEKETRILRNKAIGKILKDTETIPNFS